MLFQSYGEMKKTPVNYAILGPTGSGKTAVAHCLAHAIDSVIISCDSMQVYRGMDIGSAKPSREQLQKFDYRLIDFIDIHETWNLNLFLHSARPLIKDLNKDGKSVLLVGGTGLYAKALLYGYELAAADSRVYNEIYTQAISEKGRKELRNEIIQAEKGRIPENIMQNPRRLARTVEIIRLQGKLPKKFNKTCRSDFQQFIIMPESKELRGKIEARSKQMLENGWIEETRALLKRNLMESSTARQVLGYDHVAAYIEGAIESRGQLLQRIQHRTWQYARRQRTWFRHQHPGASILTLKPNVSPEQIAEAILSIS